MPGESQENEPSEDGVNPSTDQTPDDTASGETEPAGLDCIDESVEADHLEGLPDGSGCVEVWEHLADRRGDDG